MAHLALNNNHLLTLLNNNHLLTLLSNNHLLTLYLYYILDIKVILYW
jgi:hypothetical protein